MKKLFLLFALVVSLCANAQLTVLENGRVHVGNTSSEKLSTVADLIISSDFPSAEGVTMSYPGNGRIAFGTQNGTYIYGGGSAEALRLVAPTTISFGVGAIPSAVALSTTTNALISVFNMKAPSFLTLSDARLKKNVASLSDSFEMLKDVTAISYNLTQPSPEKSDIMTIKESAKEHITIEDDRTHFGFIA